MKFTEDNNRSKFGTLRPIVQKAIDWKIDKSVRYRARRASSEGKAIDKLFANIDILDPFETKHMAREKLAASSDDELLLIVEQYVDANKDISRK